ncbi:hypothetical protein CU048_13765 [Beijerinckiaceae bacterium]|nr:hypothetical protein CU048_13765 [Beijerinckiaceae bacterium]
MKISQPLFAPFGYKSAAKSCAHNKMLNRACPAGFVRCSSGEGIMNAQAQPRPKASTFKEAKVKKDADRLLQSDVDKDITYLQARLGAEPEDAPISENWDIVRFWMKLFAFSGLLMAQFAGVMMGRILRNFRFNILRNAKR